MTAFSKHPEGVMWDFWGSVNIYSPQREYGRPEDPPKVQFGDYEFLLG